MGNNRNSLYSRHGYRHVFRKRKPQQHIKRGQGTRTTDRDSTDKTQLVRAREESDESVTIEGARIINIGKLVQCTNDLVLHGIRCGGSVVISGETRFGLASILTWACVECKHTITLKTSEKVKGPSGYSRWEVNLAAVWGHMCIGSGHSHLEESMSVMGVPVMTKSCFISTERQIGLWWKEKLKESMLEAGREEKRLAEERGSFHEGVPAITVIVDGGWSKRSHKHSYNANSGVAIIVGKATGKLLHIGVRNKFCTACSLNIAKDQHQCFKNWNASSSEMETDVIVEGFCEAERVHGVRYITMVGDGDSSVYPSLIQRVPGWGHCIRKLECANHCCKCYRGALERLVQENSSYKGSGGLAVQMRRRLVSAARCAIRMRSKHEDRKVGVRLLRQDLVNGPNHCFGNHQKCSPDFCSTAKEQLQATPTPAITSVSEGPSTAMEEDHNSDDGLDCKFSPVPKKEKKVFIDAATIVCLYSTVMCIY